MNENTFDIIVIGAGAAGLMASWELAMAGKKVAIIEARDRIGGRIHTIHDPLFDLPVELGAEFIHGKLASTHDLLKRGNISPYDVSGDIWQHKDGILDEQKDFIENYDLLKRKFKNVEKDISVAEFFENHLQEDNMEEVRFSLRNYVEGYYAADISKASTLSLYNELENSGEKQFRIEGGYRLLTEYLHSLCIKTGVSFFLSEPVEKISWSKGHVSVAGKNKTISSNMALVTVPVGVLQTEKIKFLPGLPQKMSAARRLGYGHVVKVLLQFKTPFWKEPELTNNKNLEKLSFLFTSSNVPTWWTYHPKEFSMITGWSGGPHADRIKAMDDEKILQLAIESLSETFETDTAYFFKQLKAWHIANWSKDDFSCGAYSFDVVNGTAFKKIITDPEQDTLFFAGEGLINGPEIGTVNAALVSGREMARLMIASFKKQT